VFMAPKILLALSVDIAIASQWNFPDLSQSQLHLLAIRNCGAI